MLHPVLCLHGGSVKYVSFAILLDIHLTLPSTNQFFASLLFNLYSIGQCAVLHFIHSLHPCPLAMALRTPLWEPLH